MIPRRAFTVWLGRVLLPRRIPGQTIPEKSDLQEVDAMLAETVQEWTQQWKMEGIQEGIREGSANFLLLQLEEKFGHLPHQIREKISKTEHPTLEKWGIRLLKANSLGEIFDS
ncbi:MAG: DUF4351 domain-containing protein [Magnetococcales bacterium]|nr:DUF4351 domain-containing protein [Magnetococcales bacterium]